jgi:hypothetical protein
MPKNDALVKLFGKAKVAALVAEAKTLTDTVNTYSK